PGRRAKRTSLATPPWPWRPPRECLGGPAPWRRAPPRTAQGRWVRAPPPSRWQIWVGLARCYLGPRQEARRRGGGPRARRPRHRILPWERASSPADARRSGRQDAGARRSATFASRRHTAPRTRGGRGTRRHTGGPRRDGSTRPRTGAVFGG